MLDRQLWEGANFDNSAIRLTNIILGYDGEELSETLKTIAWEIGIRHIVYLRFAPEKSNDPSSRTTIATYPKEWQTDYFLKGYEHFDPVVVQGRNALLPFDWETLARDDPRVLAFFADAAKHGVGRNGLSFETEGVNAPWFPSLAITPGLIGPDISAQTCPGCKICRPLLTRLRTPTRSFRCPRSCCPGARRNA